MQATEFETLREMVLHYSADRGWRTQRHIAVASGLDETALSRFLNGEQDIGARRTHALFQAVGVPIERYDLAYTLLGQAQDLARTIREARSARRSAVELVRPGRAWRTSGQATAGESPNERELDRVQLLGVGPSLHAAVGPLRPLPEREQTRYTIRDLVAPRRGQHLGAGVDAPATVVVALFAAEHFTGAEIAAFFAN